MSNFSYSNSDLSRRRIGNWLLLEKLGSGFSGEWALFATFEVHVGCGHTSGVELTVHDPQVPFIEPLMCIPSRNRSLL